MCWENSIETCIFSRVKQITSPGWMHETSARGWCTGKTQTDGVGREEGGGIGMGNTCKSMADSCQCMAKGKIICQIANFHKLSSLHRIPGDAQMSSCLCIAVLSLKLKNNQHYWTFCMFVLHFQIYLNGNTVKPLRDLILQVRFYPSICK